MQIDAADGVTLAVARAIRTMVSSVGEAFAREGRAHLPARQAILKVKVLLRDGVTRIALPVTPIWESLALRHRRHWVYQV